MYASASYSLSPIQKQAIGEFSSSQFPLNLSFEYLPPALPPKRQMSGGKTSIYNTQSCHGLPGKLTELSKIADVGGGSLMNTPVTSPKLTQSMHYESVSDTTTTLSTSTSMSSQYPLSSSLTTTMDNRNMGDRSLPITSSTTTITDQLPLDTPSTAPAVAPTTSTTGRVTNGSGSNSNNTR